MLALKKIRKVYHVGDIATVALDDISLEFREKEFVAILGSSGSGKTTALNIIGGLDRYDSGDLVIKGKPTKEFKDRDWDAYRNNSVGFVFQSYNLINHLSIVANVELGMTLSGVDSVTKRKKALEVLEKVGLKDHLHKNPNQLSGGQMQRVAIARALATDPEILLCDEPTGALDSKTSVQIMDLIKEIASDRLVIMVTHDPELATDYADRIIEFKDGIVLNDSNPYTSKKEHEAFNLKKTSMSFFTALKLSFNNIMTKKGRTALTMIASSFGIIGIAVILSLSNGFQVQIDQFQRDTMAEYPIILSQEVTQVDKNTMTNLQSTLKNDETVTSDKVFLYDVKENQIGHKNNFSDDYMRYLEQIDPNIASSIGMTRVVTMNLVREKDETYLPVSFNNGNLEALEGKYSSSTSDINAVGISSYPRLLKDESENYLEKNYEVLSGSYPSEITDLALVVDSKNELDTSVLKNLGFDLEGINSINFSDLIGTEFKLIDNDDYYTQTPSGNYLPNTDYKAMYTSNESTTVRIVGIVRLKEDGPVGVLASGIVYSDDLAQLVIDKAQDSNIVVAQRTSTKNIITTEEMTLDDKEAFLSVLGGSSKPFMIMVYPENFEDKDAVLSYLDSYNVGKTTHDKVLYTDLAGTISELTSGIMDGITTVLIAFAAISLVVSLIMIGIITYISVIERTKEIGVLKALGARKKDITRVFDAETMLLGLFSGLLGICLAYALTIPMNSIIKDMSGLANVAQLQITHALILVLISTVLTVLGGHLPARIASKKNAVEALRSE